MFLDVILGVHYLCLQQYATNKNDHSQGSPKERTKVKTISLSQQALRNILYEDPNFICHLES